MKILYNKLKLKKEFKKKLGTGRKNFVFLKHRGGKTKQHPLNINFFGSDPNFGMN